MKYYCGYSKDNTTDSTQNQILTALGYSISCGNNKQSLSEYNSLLLKNNLIDIKSYTDGNGHARNIYSIIIEKPVKALK